MSLARKWTCLYGDMSRHVPERTCLSWGYVSFFSIFRDISRKLGLEDMTCLQKDMSFCKVLDLWGHVSSQTADMSRKFDREDMTCLQIDMSIGDMSREKTCRQGHV